MPELTTLFTISAAVLVIHIVQSQAHIKAVHEACTTNDDCPLKSSCRPTSCDGFTCLCNDGFVARQDRTECFQAVRIGEPCSGNYTRCISEYAKCKAGVCECIHGFVATKDGRCKMPGTNFVGEQCGVCEFPAKCVNSVCKCAGEFRSLTTVEFWVDPISTLQCRPNEYSLDMCNGTSIDPSSPAVTKTKDFSLQNKMTSNDWSLIMAEKSIYESCDAHSQCPSNSRCKPNSCDGFLCLCDVGYITSEDRLQCLPAVKTGAVCNPRIDTCLSQFASCNSGICDCMQYFSPTIDGRCRMANNRYVGEQCRASDECEYPATCENGQCACALKQRELTKEEFWIDPSLTIQCRPKEASLWKCNGSIIHVPEQFQNDIPIDIEIELTYKKDSHVVHDHENHVEVNPTIVVEEPKTDDEFFVPLHIAGIVAAAMFALLIACIFKTKRRKAIKRDISLTRTNILANKSLSTEEDYAQQQMTMERVMSIPPPGLMTMPPGSTPAVHIPRPNVSIYNKNGWQQAHDGYGDVTGYDNHTDIYPESHSTTRSTGPFIIESPKNNHGMSMRGTMNSGQMGTMTSGQMGAYLTDAYKLGQNTVAVGPYLVDGHTRNGSYVADGHKMGLVTNGHPASTHAHYANSEQWQQECQSDNDIDLVMF